MHLAGDGKWGYVIDNWWQTELGGPALGTPPSMAMRPGKVGVAVPGAGADVVDEDGNPVPPNVGGTPCYKAPFPLHASYRLVRSRRLRARLAILPRRLRHRRRRHERLGRIHRRSRPLRRRPQRCRTPHRHRRSRKRAGTSSRSSRSRRDRSARSIERRSRRCQHHGRLRVLCRSGRKPGLSEVEGSAPPKRSETCRPYEQAPKPARKIKTFCHPERRSKDPCPLNVSLVSRGTLCPAATNDRLPCRTKKASLPGRLPTPKAETYAFAPLAFFPVAANSASDGTDSGSVFLRSGNCAPVLNVSTSISIARSVFGRMKIVAASDPFFTQA